MSTLLKSKIKSSKKGKKDGKEIIKEEYCDIGDTLILISTSFYQWKDGHFYIVSNAKNGKRFTIDEKDVTEIKLSSSSFSLD